MRTYRISLALILVITFLLVKSHLNSIGSGPQKRDDGKGADVAPELVLEEHGAHIELVSKDYVPTPPARSRSASTTVHSHTHTPTGKTYPEPTNPAMPKRWVPETVPVYVPGPKFWDDEDGFEFWRNYWREVDNEQKRKASKPKVTPMSDRIVVLGRMSWEDTTWLEDELPEWQHAVYVIDDPDADLHVQQNKGKESNVYLQYIMDHYDNLPQYMVFLHAHRISPHIEFFEQDNALTIQRLQLDYLRQMGYVNLRCDWGPGCPDEVQPFRQLEGRTTEIAFAGAWIRIFNNTDVPEVVATPCCAQFAVTREQVLARPLSDYQNYHRWLMETELDDETSGRVFEYLWHIIFGQDPVFCPPKAQCYNDVYATEYYGDWDWSMMPEEDWAVSGSFMDNGSPLGDGGLPASNDDDVFQATVALSVDDNDEKVTDDDFSKM